MPKAHLADRPRGMRHEDLPFELRSVHKVRHCAAVIQVEVGH